MQCVNWQAVLHKVVWKKGKVRKGDEGYGKGRGLTRKHELSLA